MVLEGHRLAKRGLRFLSVQSGNTGLPRVRSEALRRCWALQRSRDDAPQQNRVLAKEAKRLFISFLKNTAEKWIISEFFGNCAQDLAQFVQMSSYISN